MREILTESFCERCGTKYTFEAAHGHAEGRLGRARTLARGLRNYVLSDDPLDEALAAARREEDRTAASHQLEAFHKTFNFCIDCRQYTCTSCWNEAQGRCLSCAPLLDMTPLPALIELPADRLAAAVDGNGHLAEAPERPRIDASAWPTIDLVAPPELPADLVAPPEVLAAGEPVAETAPPEPSHAAASAMPAAGTLPVAETAPVPEVVPFEPTPIEPAARAPAVPSEGILIGDAGRVVPPPLAPIRFFVPEPADGYGTGPQEAAGEPPIEPEAPAVEAPAVETPAVEVAAAAAFEPLAAELAAAEVVVPPEVSSETPAPPAAPAGPETTPAAPAWQMVAPETPAPPWPPQTPVYEPPSRPPTMTPPRPPVAPWASPAPPSAWPPAPVAQAPGPAWPPASRAVAPDVWIESSRDVLDRPGSGVRACLSCGLPLSATAHFCRRCGTRQE